MNFSFVIVTANSVPNAVINSVYMQNIPRDKYEIVVVGGEARYAGKNITHIPFDDAVRPGHITKKKNDGIKAAKFENVVVMHDYLKLCPHWYIGWIGFPTNFDIASNKIINPDFTRWRDFCYWDKDGKSWIQREPWCPNGLFVKGSPRLAPYNASDTENFYINGTYWIAKRQFMLNNPLNENLCWGQAEDIEWSLRIRNKMRYMINTNAIVKLIKQKPLIIGNVDA